MLFENGINLFIDNCKALGKSDKTINNYKKNLVRFNEFLVEEYNRPLLINEVNSDDLTRFIFKYYNPKEYSSSMRHGIVTAFKSMYNYLDRKGLCENKGKLVKYEKVQSAEREVLSEIEFKKVILNIKTPTTRAVLYTLYYSGIRINEAVNLKLCDVDFEYDLIHVKYTKTKEDRDIPMNSKLKKVLQDYLNNGREDRKTDCLFSSYPLGKISAQIINRNLRKAVINAGIEKKISAHNLRHSFASNLVLRGVDVVTLKKLLGHSKLKTTSIYCHTTLAELQEAVNVL
jgi:integrase/recombinase XerD